MSSLSFVIRDAVADDLDSCVALDHTYETDYVWQMNITPEMEGQSIRFSKERLPRPVEHTYAVDRRRLLLALADDHCFLVAVGRDDEQTMVGYLTMRLDKAHRIALIQDIVVARTLRRRKVGKRLLGVARQWAREQDVTQILIETQTKNYPAIEFCQQNGLSFCGYNDQYFRNQDIAIFFGQALR